MENRIGPYLERAVEMTKQVAKARGTVAVREGITKLAGYLSAGLEIFVDEPKED